MSRFPLCSEADDMAWTGAALLGTQSTKNDSNNWEEHFCLEQLREQLKISISQAQARATGKVSVQQHPLPPIIFNVGNP